MTFFRSAWCTFCVEELQALDAALPQVVARSVGLHAITRVASGVDPSSALDGPTVIWFLKAAPAM
jgi:hypothetical protein